MTLMTRYLVDDLGNPHFTESQTMVWYHGFVAACYSFSIIGGIISDVFWGKYKITIIFSFLYCFGYLILAIFSSKTGLLLGFLDCNWPWWH